MNCPLCNHTTHTTTPIDRKHLAKLYKKTYGIDITHTINQPLFYTHCKACDLRFFHLADGTTPSGDNSFYNTLNKLPWYYLDEKSEYHHAKQFIKPSDKVLEVGSGKGAFAKHIPQAHYTGLEFSTDAKLMAQDNGFQIHNISIQDYADTHPQNANVVCSFQVLEHVENPRAFLSAKLKGLMGGGVMIIAVPSEESFLHFSTNAILNMPPHHISRFSDKCLTNIAEIFNLKLLQIHHEKVQPEHFNSYKATMFSKRFFTPKLLSKNPLIKLTNRLGRYLEKIPPNAYGHTAIAVYQKT